jgi:phosphatidylglycerophosphatase A
MWWRELCFTALYSGYVPLAPGTAGTVIGMAVYLVEVALLGQWAWAANLAVVVLGIYPAIRLCDEAEHFFSRKDPQEVVLDEVFGYWISVLFMPFSWKAAIAAFFLFRVIDMAKPYPVNKLQNLHGGLGIMIDDCISGVYANLIIVAATVLFHITGWHVL